MAPETNIIERAFELARSGECANATAIVNRLRKEGYAGAHAHLSGAGLRKQLNNLCAQADPTERPKRGQSPCERLGSGSVPEQAAEDIKVKPQDAR